MISVIIPTYNRYQMLYEAVSSVYAQSYKNIEVIIIDDNSSDNTKDIQKDFPKVRFYRNETNRGPGYSRKYGFNVSEGKYIIFLDDDDYYIDKNFFANAVKLMENNDRYIFVSANAQTEDFITKEIKSAPINVSGEMNSVEYLKGFPYKYEKPLSTFTTVFRKSNLLKSGFENMKMVNDMAIYMRSLRDGKIYFFEYEVGRYRIHNNNISKNISADFLIDNLKEKLEVYQYIIDKRLFENTEEWWREQVNVTVGYYVYGTRPQINEYQKVYKWCMHNSKNDEELKKLLIKYKKYLIDYLISDCKRIIKKWIGIKS